MPQLIIPKKEPLSDLVFARVPKELRLELSKFARKESRTESEVVRAILQQFFTSSTDSSVPAKEMDHANEIP